MTLSAIPRRDHELLTCEARALTPHLWPVRCARLTAPWLICGTCVVTTHALTVDERSGTDWTKCRGVFLGSFKIFWVLGKEAIVFFLLGQFLGLWDWGRRALMGWMNCTEVMFAALYMFSLTTFLIRWSSIFGGRRNYRRLSALGLGLV